MQFDIEEVKERIKPLGVVRFQGIDSRSGLALNCGVKESLSPLSLVTAGT
jgi:hypothetical protein